MQRLRMEHMLRPLFVWFLRLFPNWAKDRPLSCSTEIEVFLSLAAKSGLRSAAELRDAANAFRRETQSSFENRRAELDTFCNQLVESGLLTRWQCEMLLNGRWKGFFMGTFKLLRYVGCEGNCSNYAAEDVNTKQRVLVRVSRGEQGQVHYEVYETTDPG